MGLLEDANFIKTVRECQKVWTVPGLAINVVDLDSGYSATKGYTLDGAVADLDIDDRTLFPIASNTKLFTVIAVGILIEEGKISGWDAKLRDLLPGFDMQDHHARDTLTLADILSHRGGLGSKHWLVQISAEHSCSDAPAAYRDLRQSNLVRGDARYDNTGFFLAGHIIEELSGSNYCDFVTERILRPLGMQDARWPYQWSASASSVGVGSPILVEPYDAIVKTGQVLKTTSILHRITTDSWTNPAGGLLASGRDLRRWMEYLLRLSSDRLKPSDPKIVSSATIREILRPRTLATQQIGAVSTRTGQSLFPELSPGMYALGQLKFHYQGLEVSGHNGTLPGGSSTLLWIPGGSFGLFVTCNVYHGSFTLAPTLVLAALDAHSGFARLPWIERFRSLHTETQRPPACLSSDEGWPDRSGVCPDIAGTFEEPRYGWLTIMSTEQLRVASREELSTISKLATMLRGVTESFREPGKRAPEFYGFWSAERVYPMILCFWYTGGTGFCLSEACLHEVEKDRIVFVPNWVTEFGSTPGRMDAYAEGLEYTNSYCENATALGMGQATFGGCIAHGRAPLK